MRIRDMIKQLAESFDKLRMTQTVKIYTDLVTLKKAWVVLNDCEIAGLLTGDTVETSVKLLCDNLLDDGRFEQLIEIVTHRTWNFNKMTLVEAMGIVTRFFVQTGSALSIWRQMLTVNRVSQEN